MLGLCGLAAEAGAASVDEERLSAMAATVSPLVESFAGHAFEAQPGLSLVKAREARETLAMQIADRLSSRGGLEQVEARSFARQAVGEDLAGASGGYAAGQIYLFGDRLESWFDEHALPPALLEPVTECLLAHHLAHALQDQVAPMPPPADLASAHAALVVREGFAILAQQAVCRERGHDDAMAVLHEIQGLSKGYLDDSFAMYSAGGSFVDKGLQDGGVEGMWAVVREPPADVVSLVGEVYPEYGGLIGVFQATAAQAKVGGPPGQLTRATSDDLLRMGIPAQETDLALTYQQVSERGREVFVRVVRWPQGDPARHVRTVASEQEHARVELLARARTVEATNPHIEMIWLGGRTQDFVASERIGADAAFGVEDVYDQTRAYLVARDELLVFIALAGVNVAKPRVADALGGLFDYDWPDEMPTAR